MCGNNNNNRAKENYVDSIQNYVKRAKLKVGHRLSGKSVNWFRTGNEQYNECRI